MVDRLMSNLHAALRLWPIVLLRIYTGLFFAWHGFGKLQRGNFAEGLEGFLNAQAGKTFGFINPSSNRWSCQTKPYSRYWLHGGGSWQWVLR